MLIWIMPTVTSLFIKSQWKCESRFSMHNECNSSRTCRAQLGLEVLCPV